MEGFDGRFLDGSDHSLGLAVRPGVIGLGQPVLDAVFLADPLKDVDQPSPALAALELDELELDELELEELQRF